MTTQPRFLGCHMYFFCHVYLLPGTKQSRWPQLLFQFTLISPGEYLGFCLSITFLEIGGPGGAIYLPYLVLHHTAQSAQNEMSTLQGLGTQSNDNLEIYAVNQGLTLRFQATCQKRSFDKNQWSKTRFLVINLLSIRFWNPSLKNLGAHSKIQGYAPGSLGESNPEFPL